MSFFGNHIKKDDDFACVEDKNKNHDHVENGKILSGCTSTGAVPSSIALDSSDKQSDSLLSMAHSVLDNFEPSMLLSMEETKCEHEDTHIEEKVQKQGTSLCSASRSSTNIFNDVSGSVLASENHEAIVMTPTILSNMKNDEKSSSSTCNNNSVGNNDDHHGLGTSSNRLFVANAVLSKQKSYVYCHGDESNTLNDNLLSALRNDPNKAIKHHDFSNTDHDFMIPVDQHGQGSSMTMQQHSSGILSDNRSCDIMDTKLPAANANVEPQNENSWPAFSTTSTTNSGDLATNLAWTFQDASQQQQRNGQIMYSDILSTSSSGSIAPAITFASSSTSNIFTPARHADGRSTNSSSTTIDSLIMGANSATNTTCTTSISDSMTPPAAASPSRIIMTMANNNYSPPNTNELLSTKTEELIEDERFRPYQSEQWSQKYIELSTYKEKTGHCNVPHTYSLNYALGRWVKRQRHQFKRKMEGKMSTMTNERIVALEQIGFIWDSHKAAWEEKLNELKHFRSRYGHCQVPNQPEYRQLNTWIKYQRRQFKLFWEEGKESNINLERIGELEKLDFDWNIQVVNGSTLPASSSGQRKKNQGEK